MCERERASERERARESEREQERESKRERERERARERERKWLKVEKGAGCYTSVQSETEDPVRQRREIRPRLGCCSLSLTDTHRFDRAHIVYE